MKPTLGKLKAAEKRAKTLSSHALPLG